MTPLLAGLFDADTRDEVAVEVDGDSSTRAELIVAARTFAASIPPGSGPIAIHAERTLETVVAVVGCITAGVPFVPVAPDTGAAEREHILSDSQASHFVGPRDLAPLSRLAVDLDGGAVMSSELPDIAETAAAAILYTSGTTGVPKGVIISRKAIVASLEGLADAWRWTSADTVAHGLPLFHAHGLIFGLLGSLHVGSRFIHISSPTPDNYARAEATMYFGVPTIWNRIAGSPAAAAELRRARLLISGSAPLSVHTFHRLRELTGHELIERYGMTETLIVLSTRADGERRPGWVGLPLAGFNTRLRAEDGQPVPADGESVGRLEVRGPSLFDGYVGRPDADRASWTDDGWFITGDLAVIDSRGFHRLVGRESVDLIKSGGYRIGAGEVEDCLRNVPGIQEAVVVGAPDTDLGQRIVALVILEDSSTDDAARDELETQLIAHVAGELSWHKRPREIRFVTDFPRTPMGKVQKRLLLEDLATQAGNNSS